MNKIVNVLLAGLLALGAVACGGDGTGTTTDGGTIAPPVVPTE